MDWIHKTLGRVIIGVAVASVLLAYSPLVLGRAATKEWQTPGCISPPYPTVPAGPTASMVVTGQLPATYQVRFTAWRVPCGPADHQLLFTLEPIAGTPRPLLLTIQFIQNNQQYMAFASRTPDPLLVPSTVLMEVDPPPGGGTEFDDDLGFEAVFIDAIAGIVGRLTVPAAPANGAMGALALRGAFSGSWFDANRPGQGLMLEFGRVGNTRRVAFVSWYVQINGQQAWIAGNAINPAIKYML